MTHHTLSSVQEHLTCDEELAQKITLLAGQMNAGNHSLITLIAEFDQRKGWSGGGTVRSCAHWLNWQCGIALGAAREKVRVAHCLAQLPLIDASFASGKISYSKVRAMTRVATPENEDFLLMIARHGTASHVEKVVAKYKSVQTTNETVKEREQENTRKLVYFQDQNDMWVIHAKRLSCDASLVTVLEDEQGRVLNIGRRTRTVPASIARALAIRDKTCRVPGCCESRYVDFHHIKHWADGGETSLDNLVTLCRAHHRQLHQGNFTITAQKKETGQHLVFSTRSGKSIKSSVFPQFPHVSAETPADALRYAAPAVDAKTCIPHWHGEDCDYGMAIEALLQRDEAGGQRVQR